MYQQIIAPKVRPWVCPVDIKTEQEKAQQRYHQHADLFYRGTAAVFDYKKMKEIVKSSLSQ